MNKEKQRIAIAKACGWTVINGYICHVTPDKNNEPVIATIAPLPDYCHDLNAMHEAEKVLTEDDAEKFRAWLLKLNGYNHDRVVSCTAEQRAEAFLRTLGKWAID